MATNPKGPYRMKKPRPVRRGGQKTLLTHDQHAQSQQLMYELDKTKRDIVVTAIMWSEPHSAKDKANLLAELKRCTDHYKKLMTFPKVATPEADE